ncbi:MULTISPECIES: hypothetical protein [Thermomonosporaceae]|uniref:hypothetical protein n=1 Tax=Thermomonosporaceae TaxID=2012 RepID=UPI00255AB480|nr:MULTISPECIES: hypothetical protein [Thermomonosporaceae]MDL4774069.1 hypothetical protein [Actinomadura xylanilytica]
MPLPDTEPSPPLGDPGDPHRVLSDTDLLALMLFTVWATRTGRTLPPVPVADLTAEELEDFWADDQLEQPVRARVPAPRLGTDR